MAERLCTEPGCGRRHLARGLCKQHYKRRYETRPQREFVCSWCEITFLGSPSGKGPRRYCSIACQAEAKSERYRGRRRDTPPNFSRLMVKLDWRHCLICDREIIGWPFTAGNHHQYCCPACTKEGHRRRMRALHLARFPRTERPCAWCGLVQELTSSQRFCSRRCQKAADRSRRKARRRSGELITILEIGDREAWRCHICRRRVRHPDQPGPRRMAPTLDHLAPLSKDGEHVRTNVRLAHHGCNSRRGVDRIPAQLILGVGA